MALELWLIFALAANLFYTCSSLLDQNIRRSKINDTRSFLLIWIAIFSLIWLAAIPFIDITIPKPWMLLAAVSAGAMVYIPYFAYVNAVEHQDLSHVTTIFQLRALFTLLFAWVLLNEILTAINYLGFALMVAAGLLFTIKRKESKWHINRPLAIFFASLIFFAFSSVLTKIFFKQYDYWNGFFWFGVGYFVAFFAILLIPGTFSTTKKIIKSMNKKSWAFITLNVIFASFGDFSTLAAVNFGAVSLVSAVGSTQIIFVFIATVFLSMFFPQFHKDPLDRKTLSLKILGISLMVIGLLLVN